MLFLLCGVAVRSALLLFEARFQIHTTQAHFLWQLNFETAMRWPFEMRRGFRRAWVAQAQSTDRIQEV
jgi:hypothetical protein